jgi:hypothetical protein
LFVLSLVSLHKKAHHHRTFLWIGDVRFKGTENRSMAGVAEQDSIHMNIQNPASYANLKLTTLL